MRRRKARSGNKSSGNKPEMRLRKALWSAGMRGYRTNLRGLPGTPDIVFIRDQVAIFVDGCFWHGCPEHYSAPKTRAAFWRSKKAGSGKRDIEVTAELEAKGWTVVRVWEHQVRDDLEGCLSTVRAALTTSNT
jgi:DNA mismatch endonuclease (patch repair protein)